VLRGKALRAAVILRLLAVERLFRGVVLLGIAYAIYRFHQDQASLQQLFARDWPILRDAANQLHFDADSSAVVNWAKKILFFKSSMLTWVTYAVLAYGLIQLVEATGLWLLKRWGEYFAVVATSAFIPLEIYELTRHATPTKIVAIIVNVAAVVYLVLSKRLFGIRGGYRAYERELESQSLLEVQQATDVSGESP
jgi:uncharacterized membrane protein (DUF2068 family)